MRLLIATKWLVACVLSVGVCIASGQVFALDLDPKESEFVAYGSGVDSGHIPILTLMLEGDGEGIEGMQAIGEVIRNRAKARRMTWAAVCMQPKQFSAWNSPAYVERRLAADDGSAYQRASRAWELSASSNLVGDSCHYHAKSILPYWAKGRAPYARIANHVFYEGVA